MFSNNNYTATAKKDFINLFKEISEKKATSFLDISVLNAPAFDKFMLPALKEVNLTAKNPVKVKILSSDLISLMNQVPDKAAGITSEIGENGSFELVGDIGNQMNRNEEFLATVFEETFQNHTYVITRNMKQACDLDVISNFESCKTHPLNIKCISATGTFLPVPDAFKGNYDYERYNTNSGLDYKTLKYTSDKNALFIADCSFMFKEAFLRNFYPALKSINKLKKDGMTLTIHQAILLEMEKVTIKKPWLAGIIRELRSTIHKDMSKHTLFKFGSGMTTNFVDSDILSTAMRNIRNKSIVIFSLDRKLTNDLIRLNNLQSVNDIKGVYTLGFDRNNELVPFRYRNHHQFDRQTPDAEPGFHAA